MTSFDGGSRLAARTAPAVRDAEATGVVQTPVAQVAGRNVELDRFYRAEMPRLLRFLLLQGVPPADAADAAQQAFVEVCLRWDRVRRMDSPAGYLRRVASNDWAKQNRRRSTDVDRAVRGHWAHPAVIEDIYGNEQVRLVVDSLSRLPARQRQVMAWLYDGYSYEEIAEQVGMRVATVRSTVRHAKEKLRSLGIGRGEG